jgi:hypothetical protein
MYGAYNVKSTDIIFGQILLKRL